MLTLPEVGSTNDWLRENASQFPDGQWVRAERQTSGRGRLGRQWQMPEGNLAMSGLIRPQPGEGNPAELGFVAALALHDVMAGLTDTARLQLKWPNDVLLDGAKLSGILLEREGDQLVLGIGVNIVAAPKLPDRATISLADLGLVIAAADFAERLAASFAARRAEWRAGGFAATRAEWLARAHPIGTPLWASQQEGRVAGRFAGLDPDGALRLDGEDGRVHVIHAGDVWGAPPAIGPTNGERG
ncbi:biotin--[acetyl-CoA-carboxylase] ligase [Sandaracinobacter neustonicus]|uniref:biotin--[acetyl-CoA-carboxylase] ligase n=1 Tax=Sandaracinobacter neustonicus TaxID=1715348 RepID=UPI0022A77021|nr:biotin--[acetyl-CoA-carboxylase] ligase [Sandaracinobacter neustonicus]